MRELFLSIIALFSAIAGNYFSLLSKYPWHRQVTATVFWIGEEESEDNDFISNSESIWDKTWQQNYGGIDDPKNRNGFLPKDFTPSQNPFYIALPYTDISGGVRKENSKNTPWYESEAAPSRTILKNRWLELQTAEKSCYAQWEDVGPFETDDYDYVFGEASPKNNFGVGAGIDISPAVRDCLGVGDVSKLDWRFVDFEDVPDGDWKKIITND